MRQLCVDLSWVVQELFDFSKPGAVAIPNFLSPYFRERVLDEVLQNDLFMPIAREYGQAVQEMEVFYCGETDVEHKVQAELPALSELFELFQLFHERLSRIGGFAPGGPNSVGVHRYPKGSVGLTPHLDHSRYVNVIGTVTLGGSAPFYVSKTRDGQGKVFLEASPGSLILLRAPRNSEENKWRPLHAVDRVEEDRYSVIFRQLQKPLARELIAGNKATETAGVNRGSFPR